MKDNRNIRNIVLLVVLILTAVVIFYFQNRGVKAEVDPATFKTAELSKIDEIQLKSSKGTVKLSYDGSKWLVNDKYDADKQRITVLFATLERAVPKRRVAAIQYDSISRRLNETGVTVTQYEKGQVRTSFLAGGNAQKTESYFEDASKDVFLVTIPGYRVYVSQVFELGENDWRDTRIFAINWEDFKDMTSDLPSVPGQGFTLEKADGDIRMKEDAKADTGKVFSFLDDISYLIADRIISPGMYPVYDSLAKTPPAAILTVADIANRSFELRLFAPLKGDPMILGITNVHGLILLDQKRAYRVLRKRSYFR